MGPWRSGSIPHACWVGITRWLDGGNTSVKIRERNLFGDDEDNLDVKGSGWHRNHRSAWLCASAP